MNSWPQTLKHVICTTQGLKMTTVMEHVGFQVQRFHRAGYVLLKPFPIYQITDVR